MPHDADSPEYFMERALGEARAAGQAGEVPVGSVIVDTAGKLIASCGNAVVATCDPSGHAEIRALRQAGTLAGNYRLTGMTLYTTLEPCAMCAGAISHARIGCLVIAAPDPKGGAVWNGPQLYGLPACNWRPRVVEGPFAGEASRLLKDFFRERR